MKLIEHAREACINLYYAKLRSLLAILGVLVGTASVVAMVLGGELATNEALKQFKSLGTDLLAVSFNSAEDGEESTSKTDQLTLADTESLATLDSTILKVAPYTQLFFPMYFNGEPINAMTLGVTEEFADIVHINMQTGRFVRRIDRYAFYCVIGQNVANTIKTMTFHDPIGQQLQIGKNIFIIIGIAASWPENNFVYANIDNAVLVPILASTLLSKYTVINNMIVRLSAKADINQVEAKISKQVKTILPSKQATYRSAKELIIKMRKQSDILTIFLGLIGSISLLVGGIGVMNIMLVSIIERRREIGIRLAVGAKPIDIAMLFLVEAIMLSLVGGVVGVFVGVLVAYLIALFSGWTFTLFLWPPIAGFTVSVAVGIFFGVYPAYQAARLNPIDALRSD